MEPEKGGNFSLFGGVIRGKFTDLVRAYIYMYALCYELWLQPWVPLNLKKTTI